MVRRPTPSAIAIATPTNPGDGALGSLMIGAAESITNGRIQLDGGTLTDSFGVTVGSAATLIGSGTVAANLSAAHDYGERRHSGSQGNGEQWPDLTIANLADRI